MKQGAFGQKELRDLLGTLKHGECGLMISLDGIALGTEKFWRDNRDRLLRPMGDSNLIQLLREHYEKLLDEQKAQLPLKRVFVPFKPDEEG